MEDMYIKGILLASLEERSSIAVLHIIDSSIVDKLVKSLKLKKYKVLYDDTLCETLIATGDKKRVEDIISGKQPTDMKDYMQLLRGAMDASAAEIYDGKTEIPIYYEYAKMAKDILRKNHIVARAYKTDSYVNGKIIISGKSLDRFIGMMSDVKGLSKTVSKELSKAK